MNSGDKKRRCDSQGVSQTGVGGVGAQLAVVELAIAATGTSGKCFGTRL